MKKYAVLSGIILGTLLLLVATLVYPGGSYANELSEGYNWGDNYISNLLSPISVNGMENGARPYAIGGILFLSIAFGWFFVKFSKRIYIKSASLVIKYLGITATLFALLTVIPSLHDIMVTLSSIFTLVVFFYITVMVLKSRFSLLKIISIAFILTFYFGAYMYFTRSYLEYMPIVQKLIYLVKIGWIIILEYLVPKDAFKSITK